MFEIIRDLAITLTLAGILLYGMLNFGPAEWYVRVIEGMM